MQLSASRGAGPAADELLRWRAGPVHPRVTGQEAGEECVWLNAPTTSSQAAVIM